MISFPTFAANTVNDASWHIREVRSSAEFRQVTVLHRTSFWYSFDRSVPLLDFTSAPHASNHS